MNVPVKGESHLGRRAEGLYLEWRASRMEGANQAQVRLIKKGEKYG